MLDPSELILKSNFSLLKNRPLECPNQIQVLKYRPWAGKKISYILNSFLCYIELIKGCGLSCDHAGTGLVIGEYSLTIASPLWGSELAFFRGSLPRGSHL